MKTSGNRIERISRFGCASNCEILPQNRNRTQYLTREFFENWKSQKFFPPRSSSDEESYRSRRPRYSECEHDLPTDRPPLKSHSESYTLYFKRSLLAFPPVNCPAIFETVCSFRKTDPRASTPLPEGGPSEFPEPRPPFSRSHLVEHTSNCINVARYSMRRHRRRNPQDRGGPGSRNRLARARPHLPPVREFRFGRCEVRSHPGCRPRCLPLRTEARDDSCAFRERGCRAACHRLLGRHPSGMPGCRLRLPSSADPPRAH